MSVEQARIAIKAAAYAVAAALGWRRAVELLNEIAREIENDQWK